MLEGHLEIVTIDFAERGGLLGVRPRDVRLSTGAKLYLVSAGRPQLLHLRNDGLVFHQAKWANTNYRAI